MSIGARIFVAVIFGALGISFIATTIGLYTEFRDAQWLDFAMFYSNLFIFFPTFGIIALIAFYIPACVFVDMYWKHIPYGKIRFIFGTILVAGLSWYISVQLVKGSVPDIWWIAPQELKADKGGTAENCDSSRQSCKYVPVLDALSDLRKKSQTRLGLSKFARECRPDPLVEKTEELLANRYCFVTQTLLNAEQCCRVQKQFTEALSKAYSKPEVRSLTQKLHILLLPLKVFFLLVLVVIGAFLAIWRNNVDTYYKDFVFYIERGLMIGVVAMLFWPIANHAFLQSREVLFGAFSDGIYSIFAPIFSIIFGAWALAIMFFFFRSMEKNVEAVGKVAGLVGSAIAILKYDEIIDYSVRIAGSGADQVTFGVLTILGFFFFFPMFMSKKKNRQKKEDAEQI
ncbi:MAG: hypothetical protein ACRBBN_10580 [Methyloligellaceae bacterium]